MKLIFIYNADHGFFHAIKDSVHKLFRPSTYPCSLCQITYGLLGKHKVWSTFLKQLHCEVQFLYRGDAKKYIHEHGSPPLVLIETEGEINILCSSSHLKQMQGVKELIRTIEQKIDL